MPLKRRDFLKIGVAGALSTASAATLAAAQPALGGRVRIGRVSHGVLDHQPSAGGSLYASPTPTGVDPMAFLTTFDGGTPGVDTQGRVVRDYELFAADAQIEVAPGVSFPAWAYNGQVPGPTLRCQEGDLVRVHFANHQTHPHTMHFHGFHAANMDGVFEQVGPGQRFTYEFRGEPFGLHLYHCHTMPIKKHIAKGLYGVFIVDPPTPRPAAKELVMVMNGFDVNFDNENEFYAVNGAANFYLDRPIRIQAGELVRVYLVNMTEFDLLNSMHTHATFFRLYRTGTRLDQYEYTDVVTLGQGERAILEFSYREPGRYMFHAHQSEFAELGWTGLFEVV